MLCDLMSPPSLPPSLPLPCPENTPQGYLKTGEIRPGVQGQAPQVRAEITASFFVLIGIFFPSVTGELGATLLSLPSPIPPSLPPSPPTPVSLQWPVLVWLASCRSRSLFLPSGIMAGSNRSGDLKGRTKVHSHWHHRRHPHHQPHLYPWQPCACAN